MRVPLRRTVCPTRLRRHCSYCCQRQWNHPPEEWLRIRHAMSPSEIAEQAPVPVPQDLTEGEPGTFRLCCYVESEELGGMETSLSTLLKALPPRFDVTLIGRSVEVLTFVARSRPGTSIEVLRPIRSKTDILAIISQIWRIRRIHPDVLHASLGHSYQAPYVSLAAVITRTRTLAVVHGIFDWSNHPQDALTRWLIRHLQVVGGVSKFVCRSIESEYGLPAGSARLLYNGIEDLPLSPPVEEGRSPGATVIGAVGRCAPEKGFDVLLRAMAELPADCRLVLLGEGAELAELTSLARELHIEDRVQFAGWVDPPWSATWKFDVLVAPSRVEAFGLVAVEAMRAKIPVIASRVGGFVEIIDDGSTGILVEPGDPSALAVAIRRLSQDPVEQKAMAERAYDSVLGRFSVEAMAQAYVEVFDGIRKP